MIDNINDIQINYEGAGDFQEANNFEVINSINTDCSAKKSTKTKKTSNIEELLETNNIHMAVSI